MICIVFFYFYPHSRITTGTKLKIILSIFNPCTIANNEEKSEKLNKKSA